MVGPAYGDGELAFFGWDKGRGDRDEAGEEDDEKD